jgi:RHS repeat-associated protein
VHGARTDEVVAQITPANNWIRYFHYDANGNCTLQTDGGGNLVEQYDYDAFGFPYFYDASGNNIGYSPWGNRMLFTGREWLRDLKLYDYRNRLYNPELGRFMQPDPKEFAAGDYNLYRYCHNDPVNRSDPTGLIDREIDKDLDKKGAEASRNSLAAALQAKDKTSRSQAVEEKGGKLSLGKITKGKTDEAVIKRPVPGGFKNYHLQKEGAIVTRGTNPVAVGHAHLDDSAKADPEFSEADKQTARGSAEHPGIPVYKVNESNPSRILRRTPQVDYRDEPTVRPVSP